MYQALDIFFFIFHTAIVLFNILGWIWKRTRKYNLILLGLTTLSWFGLGYWKGWGYCICTDWHWDVRRELGYHDGTNNYIDLLVMKTTGIEFPDAWIEMVTLVAFLVSVAMSIWLNIRDWRRSKV